MGGRHGVCRWDQTSYWVVDDRMIFNGETGG